MSKESGDTMSRNKDDGFCNRGKKHGPSTVIYKGEDLCDDCYDRITEVDIKNQLERGGLRKEKSLTEHDNNDVKDEA